jgi:hypothetical protein
VRLATLPVVALLVLTVTSAGVAQSWSARMTVGTAGVQRPAVGADTSVALRGTVLGVGGTYTLGPATLDIRYAQGGVSAAGGDLATDLVDGEIVVWVAPVRWVSLGLGPHARAFVEDGGTERWLLWELRLRSGTALVGSTVRVYCEGWRVVGAAVPVVDPFDHGWGMEGGLSVVFGRSPLGSLPFSARLTYRVEQQVVANGARRETQNRLGIGIGVGWR